MMAAAATGKASETLSCSVRSEISVNRIVDTSRAAIPTAMLKMGVFLRIEPCAGEQWEDEAAMTLAEATTTSQMSRCARKEIVTAVSSRSAKKVFVFWRRPKTKVAPITRARVSHSDSVRNCGDCSSEIKL